MDTKEIDFIEQQIDSWLLDMLDLSMPRYAYIYHCNLAYIDIVVGKKMLFSPFEKHFLFSLSYNTYIAHQRLKEEAISDFHFNRKIYDFAVEMIFYGMAYSMLCDVFPLLHSKMAEMYITGRDVTFSTSEIPRKHYKYFSDYFMRKVLSYTLQMLSGKLGECDDETIALELANAYTHFWTENMLYDDYEPYTSLEWNGINFFFIVASMRRFNKLYRCDFDITALNSQKAMIVLSPNGVSAVEKYVISLKIYMPPAKNLMTYIHPLNFYLKKPKFRLQTTTFLSSLSALTHHMK